MTIYIYKVRKVGRICLICWSLNSAVEAPKGRSKAMPRTRLCRQHGQSSGSQNQRWTRRGKPKFKSVVRFCQCCTVVLPDHWPVMEPCDGILWKQALRLSLLYSSEGWCCNMLQLAKLEVLAARPDLFARSVSSKPMIRLQAPSVVTFTHQHPRKYERCLCVQCVGNILVKVPDTHFKNICWVARAQTCGGTWSYMLAVLSSTHQILMF